MGKTAKTLTAALETIASVLHSPGVKTDRQTGQQVEVNKLAYPQEKVLNGIIYSATLTLRTTQDGLDKARAEAKAIARDHRGDEISENRLNFKLDWIEQLEEQAAALSLIVDLGSEVYERHVGKPFMPPVMRPMPRKEFQSSALERAKRLAGIDAEAQHTDGVDRPGAQAA
jgi:hypothetical protein